MPLIAMPTEFVGFMHFESFVRPDFYFIFSNLLHAFLSSDLKWYYDAGLLILSQIALLLLKISLIHNPCEIRSTPYLIIYNLLIIQLNLKYLAVKKVRMRRCGWENLIHRKEMLL
jgi:hypothetical protein